MNRPQEPTTEEAFRALCDGIANQTDGLCRMHELTITNLTKIGEAKRALAERLGKSIADFTDEERMQAWADTFYDGDVQILAKWLGGNEG